MSGHCVVAAELARARIFTLESSDVPELETSPYLRERKDLTNPQHSAEGKLWTDTRRGAHREHQGGQLAGQTTGIPHHNYDEHREDNARQHHRAFAKDVVDDLNRIISEDNINHVVLCAEKQMLGFLRPAVDEHLTNGVKLEVLPKDITNLSPHELHKKLAKDGLLPQQKRPPVPGQN